jgi:L-fuconolactonase
MASEPILEPGLPIIDPHHHLWHWPGSVLAELPPPSHGFETVRRNTARYLIDELLTDTNSGHNIRATVFVECSSMYRASDPIPLRPVGETEFVNGVAAMSASGLYGETQICAGIVGKADLTLGDGVPEVLQAHLAAGGGRFRGIRHSGSYDDDKRVLGPIARVEAGLYLRPDFRQGFAHLVAHGLSFDAWVLEPQLPELIDLARAFPDTAIVLDHVGTPLGIASYEGRLDERFPIWRDNIIALAALPNVHVKLGGLAMPFCNFPSFMQAPAATSKQLAEEWRPYIETCIEAFGPDRCMFESNFPVDSGSCSYRTLWNTFKRLTTGVSDDEKAALFSGTAARFYRLLDT